MSGGDAPANSVALQDILLAYGGQHNYNGWWNGKTLTGDRIALPEHAKHLHTDTNKHGTIMAQDKDNEGSNQKDDDKNTPPDTEKNDAQKNGSGSGRGLGRGGGKGRRDGTGGGKGRGGGGKGGRRKA